MVEQNAKLFVYWMDLTTEKKEMEKNQILKIELRVFNLISEGYRL